MYIYDSCWQTQRLYFYGDFDKVINESFFDVQGE